MKQINIEKENAFLTVGPTFRRIETPSSRHPKTKHATRYLWTGDYQLVSLPVDFHHFYHFYHFHQLPSTFSVSWRSAELLSASFCLFDFRRRSKTRNSARKRRRSSLRDAIAFATRPNRPSHSIRPSLRNSSVLCRREVGMVDALRRRRRGRSNWRSRSWIARRVPSGMKTSLKGTGIRNLCSSHPWWCLFCLRWPLTLQREPDLM